MAAMSQLPDPEQKKQAFDAFRADLNKVFDGAIERHEAKMTKLGFVFLAVFVGVIALAALLP
jgi:hypothetical protein